MPELIEVELYRRAAEQALGGRVEVVEVPDPTVLAGGTSVDHLQRLVEGRTLSAARRRGKLLLLDLAAGPRRPVVEHVLGVHFGMTGTLVVGGVPALDGLLYSPVPFEERRVRFRLRLSRRAVPLDLALHDPRRFGRVQLDPAEDALGPDAERVTPTQLRTALAGAAAVALKARLLDQHRLAGVGNLIADEVLWRAALSPERAANALTGTELQRLQRTLRSTIGDLSARGGSHSGRLMGERHPGGHCPADGAPLQCSVVGGRTSWWCPAHQH